jgi:hypothetical protein
MFSVGQRVNFIVRDENLEVIKQGFGTVKETCAFVYRNGASTIGLAIKADHVGMVYIPHVFARVDVRAF